MHIPDKCCKVHRIEDKGRGGTALFVWFEFKKLTVKSVTEISRQY